MVLSEMVPEPASSLIPDLPFSWMTFPSIVKEVALAGGCVDKMVPDFVQTSMEEKLRALGEVSNDKVKVISLRD